MRVVVVEFPDRASAKLAVRAIRPVLTAAAGPWWLEERDECWLIGGPVPTEWEDFVADTVSALGGGRRGPRRPVLATGRRRAPRAPPSRAPVAPRPRSASESLSKSCRPGLRQAPAGQGRSVTGCGVAGEEGPEPSVPQGRAAGAAAPLARASASFGRPPAV